MLPQWDIQWIEVPITVTLDAYDAGDVVGGTLSCAVPQAKGGCWIYGLKLIDDATQAEAYTLYVFNEAPSVIADTAAHAPTEADWIKCVGKIAIAAADYDTSGSAADCAFVYGLGGTDTSNFIHAEYLPDGKLYFRLVAGATPDYADADDLTLYVALYIL